MIRGESYQPLKRVLDLVIASTALLILSPLIFLIYILIKIDSHGPVIFKQERMGLKKSHFTAYKFRTMYMHAEKEWLHMRDKSKDHAGGLFKIGEDHRITRIGYLLRRSYLDELPQLWNIVKGEMSLVGPRPHNVIYSDEYTGWRKKRYDTVPGLTGLWQVSGMHKLSFDEAVGKDIEYIEKMSLWLDLKIILKTIPAIIASEGPW